MELIVDRPLERFLATIGKHPISILSGAYPFVTRSIVESQLIPWLKHKKTRLSLICNLSPFVIATSFSDPTKPLNRLIDALGDRVIIRTHPHLHAKVLIAEDRVAVFGSSNLTLGGEVGNREMNALLVGNKKLQRERIAELKRWFVGIEAEASPVDRTMLAELSLHWSKQKKIRGQILAGSPESRLGDDYWSKVKEVARRSRRSKSETEILLSGGSDGIQRKPRNFLNKLLFLRDVGVVSRWDEKWVYRADSAKEITKTPAAFFERLSLLVPAVPRVLDLVVASPNAGYKLLEEKLAGEAEENDIHIAANWLWRMGFVKRDTSGRSYSFRPTAAGKRALSPPPQSPTGPIAPS